ncbi:MAG: flagellar basal body rod protein FlgB [Bdellovibrionales bacterium]|nr:flagellar basal body rod protein FlgB [Bdellovibrionales bacterium]
MTNGLLGKVFDKNIDSMEHAMTLFWRRNSAITSNIANIETPQYRAVDLDFKAELDRAFHNPESSLLEKTNSAHLDIQKEGSARYMYDYSGMTKADGNNVDLDLQMGKMSMNAGKYSMGASIVRKKMQMLRFAIQEAMR